MNEIAPLISLTQPTFFGDCAITAAVGALASASVEQRGAIFTRREVVEFILDLSGYTADKQLCQMRLLEPSFGGGDFLFPAIERLLVSWEKVGRPGIASSLLNAISAVELHAATYQETRAKLLETLREYGFGELDANLLAGNWLVYGDFLLTTIRGGFDFVVGNPPYVRQELIADALMAEYRSRYRTIYDRADLYVPFIERSLSLLSEGGRLGFICADRWMKNRYGGPLREMVAKDFHLKIYVDMVDTPAFHSDVIAYPAITIIERDKPGSTRVAHRPPIERKALLALSAALMSSELPDQNSGVKELHGIAVGAEPWILESSDQLALVRRLEGSFPLLEEAGCKVGIGVATGADDAYIGRLDELDVEDDRKLPLVMTKDILDGVVKWRGFGVVNPFGSDGRLVELEEFPKLKLHLTARRGQIAGRHVAQKTPANWYRTIDRIYPDIAGRPKLLIPDIKGEAHIVFEDEGLYPHHNLYFIVSEIWNLRALQAVLLSGIARLFVAVYSTKMRGGYLRFQAQYLRRIRIPDWSSVSKELRARLIAAAESKDIEACNQAAFELYGLSTEERSALGGKGKNGA
ncbi:Eco57I restriction-modification methylase domain-containing protein [Mesorhizobium sp. M0030]|uniref:Eco57I restriction-modification methylase domain-containing protein n=1 Tax=Mesorhizobium sp. M0030 TaxID=2956851 RepID=UPI003337130F